MTYLTQSGRRRRSHRSLPQRARRSFWFLVVVAALAAGALSSALTAAPGPITGPRVAASGLVPLGSLTLAGRVMFALESAPKASPRPNFPP